MVLKAVSSFSVNQSVTCCGGVATLLPTRGSARSRKPCAAAWPIASNKSRGIVPAREEWRMSVPRKWDCGLSGIAEDRLADPTRAEGVEIEVQLRDDADISPALPVDWNKGFNADLEFVSNPDETRIDGAGRQCSRGEGIRHRGLEGCLDQRNEAIDEVRQAEINDRTPEIGHVVLNSSAPVQHAGMKFGVGRQIAAIRIDAEAGGGMPARNRITDLAGDSDRPQPGQGVGQIAKTFAEPDGRRVGVEGVRPDALRARPTPFHAKAHRHNELMGGVFDNPVLERGLDVLKPVRSHSGQSAGRAEMAVG